MMKSKNFIYLIAAALPLFSACSTEENAGTDTPEASNKVQLEATWDGGATRTVMAAGGSVYWTTGDNVYCNSATAPTADATFSIPLSTNTTKGDARYNKAQFTVEKADNYSLLYPSTLSGVSYSGGTYTFTFPSSQAYYDNVTFGPKVNPSTAYSTTTSMKFKNACGIAKAVIDGGNKAFTDVKAVRFIAGGQAVSGTATVTPTATGAAMTISDTYTKGTNDYMDVTFDTPIDLYAMSTATPDASPTVYWVLPAGTYTTPYIELLNSSNKIIGRVTASNDITVTRANITRLGTVEMGAYTFQPLHYEWDAYACYGTSTETFSEGNYGYNTATDGSSAEHSCKDCPTDKEIYAYLLAGAYWDDGSAIDMGDGTYSYPTSYTVDGITYNNYDTSSHTLATGSTQGGGLWLPKNSYIKSTLYTKVTGLTAGQGVEDYTGSVSYTSNMLSKGGTVKTAALATQIRKSGNYFFLPAAGYCGSGTLLYPGANGYYWSSTPDGASNAYFLTFNSGSFYVYSTYGRRNHGFCLWSVK